MHPLMIVLGAALLDIGANMAINRSLGFRHKGWGLLGILLVLCAFTLLSEAVSTGRIDLAVAYATWGAIGILGTALGGLLLFGERLKPVGWVGILVMAVAVAGSPTRGIEFLKSAERQDARRQMVRAIDSLIAADEADVLSRAKSLIVAVKAPLAEVKSTQEKVLEQNADYLSRGALKQLEDRNKRELNARERSGIMEALASARTLMRDVLLTLQDKAADVVNEDVRDTIGRLAAATNVAGATRALEAVATAERNIARNVTPQLAIEVMLFDIRKALKCR